MLKLFSNIFISLAGLLIIPAVAVLLAICFLAALLATIVKAFFIPFKTPHYAE